MKRLILAVAVLVGFGTNVAHAQSKVSFGAKAETNMSNFILDDMTGYDSEFGVGAGVGGFMKIDLGNYIAIQPELMFNWHNSKIKQNGVKSDFEYWGVELPVYAMGQLSLENGDRAYVGIGPWLQIGFSAKNKTADVNYYKKTNGARVMQPGEVGAAALIGYEFAFGMQINASYKYGFLNQLDDPVGDAFMSNQIITFGIGYRF